MKFLKYLISLLFRPIKVPIMTLKHLGKHGIVLKRAHSRSYTWESGVFLDQKISPRNPPPLPLPKTSGIEDCEREIELPAKEKKDFRLLLIIANYYKYKLFSIDQCLSLFYGRQFSHG
jgi:hypothetical protein